MKLLDFVYISVCVCVSASFLQQIVFCHYLCNTNARVCVLEFFAALQCALWPHTRFARSLDGWPYRCQALRLSFKRANFCDCNLYVCVCLWTCARQRVGRLLSSYARRANRRLVVSNLYAILFDIVVFVQPVIKAHAPLGIALNNQKICRLLSNICISLCSLNPPRWLLCHSFYAALPYIDFR